ncbi:ankyrin repeat domain-containing protein 12-like [Saccostrea echinata]|uniref:ankyrin repeat domain-containing protein 12-like n=1 Tax=Saccostrea echinata TaxID=191078 RepID=UPI002A83E0DF|nr:ankyrin repeat domain-containing protein 12-like [Saccostrea echinata]
MGRHRGFDEYLRKAADKEKKKIKESVLEVFRARSKSPGGNGAFLVAGIHGESDEGKTNTAEDRSATEDIMSPTERKSRGRKRKNNKSKEDRKRHKSEEKFDQVQAHSDSNLRHALRSAREQELHAKNAISRIARNRMTKRLGLFNQGKKSETVSRDFYILNGKRRTAEEDLEEFLHNSSIDRYSDQERHNDKISSNKTNGKEKLTVNSADLSRPETGYRSSSTSHTTTPASIQRMSAPHSILSLASSCGSTLREGNVQLSSIEDIVDKVLSRLKPQKLFPERDFVQETTDELRSIMRRNALRSSTPTPSLQRNSSIKRSLLNRYLTPRKDENKENRELKKDAVSPTVVNSKPKSKEVNQPKQYVKIPITPKEVYRSNLHKTSSLPDPPGVQEKHEPFFHDLSDIQSDAQTLLECHDQMMAEANKYMIKVTAKREEIFLEDLCNADGLDILRKQDEHARKLQEQEWRRSKDEDSWRSLFTEHNEVRSSSQTSSMSSGYQGSQILRDTGNCRTETVPAYAATIQYPEFMPQFHDKDYYSGNHTSGMSSKIKSLDILEILDNNEVKPQRGPSSQDTYLYTSNTLSSRDIIDNLIPDIEVPSRTHAMNRDSISEQRSPHRASQEEYHFCLKKPSLDTPSPPEELFKKHSLIP